MSALNISDGSLGMRFWAETSLKQIERDYAAAVCAGTNGAAPPADDGAALADTTDATMSRMSAQGGDARYRTVTGRARVLGASLRADDPSAIRIAGALGFQLDELAEDLKRMNAHRLEREDAAGAGDADAETCQRILVALLRSEDFETRAARGGTLSRAGLLALLNAGLGCLKMIREGTATTDSVFELIRGEVYDITNAADVLKMSVKTALKARETFIDAAGITARADAARAEIGRRLADGRITPEEARTACADLDRIVRDLIAERTRLAEPLNFGFDVADGSKKTVEAKLKDVREAMRAFRYDLDRLTRREMGPMERFRRWCDDIGRSQTTLDASTLERMRRLEGDFNGLLREAGQGDGLLASAAGEERATRVTDLTHTANNRIRYYFSGKEQKLEAFRRKAHEVLDGIAEKGGSRTVQFEVGADVKAGKDVLGFGAKAGLRYLRTAVVRIAPGGGEVTVTFSRGAELSAQGTVGFGLGDGDRAESWSESDRSGGVFGGHLAGKGALAGSRTSTVTYASLEDFVASLNGASDLVEVNAYKTMACIGKIGSFFRGVGHLVMKGLTAAGLRISKSNEDNAAYVARMRAADVMSQLDTMLAHRENAVKTQSGSFWSLSGSLGASADVDFGGFNGINTADDGRQTVRKLNIFSAGASVSGKYERDAFRTVTDYRTLLDEARTYTDEALNAQMQALRGQIQGLGGRMRSLGDLVAQDAAVDTDIYRCIEENLSALEDATAAEPPERRDWTRFADTLRFLMTACVYLERKGTDTSALAERLTHPAVAMPEDVYTRFLQRQTNVSHTGVRRFSMDFSVGWDVGGDLVKEALTSGTDGAVQVGRDVVASSSNTLSSVVTGVQSCTIAGRWTVSSPVDTDNVCPWSNGTVHTVSIGLTPALTTRALIEFLARRYVDQLTDITDAERASVLKGAMDDLTGTFQELVGTTALSDVWDMGVTALARIAPGIARLITSPADVTGTGLEVGLDTAYQKSINFTIVRGRLTAVTVDEMSRVGSLLGVRAGVMPAISAGLHVKETLTTSEIDRHALVRPNFDGLMGQAEQYVRSANPEGFRNLVAHNRPGVLRLFDALTGADPVHADARFAGDRAACVRRHEDVRDILAELAGRDDAVLSDRAAHLIRRYDAALRSLDTAQDDADRIRAVGDVTLAAAEVFMLAREDGGFSRNARTQALEIARAVT